MTIYSFHIYNRSGICLLSRRWHQLSKSSKSLQHEQKLLWGLLFSMRDLVNKLTPKQPLDQTQTNQLLNFQTDTYKIYYLETASGLRFVLQTDPNTNITQTTNTNTTTNTNASSSSSSKSNATSNTTPTVDPLLGVYRLYVDVLVKNPLYEIGTTITSQTFLTKFEQYIESLPYFN